MLSGIWSGICNFAGDLEQISAPMLANVPKMLYLCSMNQASDPLFHQPAASGSASSSCCFCFQLLLVSLSAASGFASN